ncbi:hypothetical protein [Streptomyces sp. NPDC004685]
MAWDGIGVHDADLYAEEGGGLGVELAANAPKNADDKPVLSRIATSPTEEHQFSTHLGTPPQAGADPRRLSLSRRPSGEAEPSGPVVGLAGVTVWGPGAGTTGLFDALFHPFVELRLCHRLCPRDLHPGTTHPEADTNHKTVGLWVEPGGRNVGPELRSVDNSVAQKSLRRPSVRRGRYNGRFRAGLREEASDGPRTAAQAGQFLQQGTDAQDIWDREIACPDGPPLRGPVLDVLEHDDSRAGHMQLVTGRPARDINKAAAAVEEAWDLLPGPVVVDSGGSGAKLWVYQRPLPPGTTGSGR